MSLEDVIRNYSTYFNNFLLLIGTLFFGWVLSEQLFLMGLELFFFALALIFFIRAHNIWNRIFGCIFLIVIAILVFMWAVSISSSFFLIEHNFMFGLFGYLFSTLNRLSVPIILSIVNLFYYLRNLNADYKNSKVSTTSSKFFLFDFSRLFYYPILFALFVIAQNSLVKSYSSNIFIYSTLFILSKSVLDWYIINVKLRSLNSKH